MQATAAVTAQPVSAQPAYIPRRVPGASPAFTNGVVVTPNDRAGIYVEVCRGRQQRFGHFTRAQIWKDLKIIEQNPNVGSGKTVITKNPLWFQSLPNHRYKLVDALM